MRARALPREEWDRLPDAVRAFAETFHPSDVAVIAVESGGAIVARMTVYRAPHWESYWMAPEWQGNAGVTRALLRGAYAQSEAWAKEWFLVHADDPETVRTVLRLGGEPLAVETFMVSRQRVEMEEVCRQQ